MPNHINHTTRYTDKSYKWYHLCHAHEGVTSCHTYEWSSHICWHVIVLRAYIFTHIHTNTHPYTRDITRGNHAIHCKGWRRPIGCLKLQVNLRKRATNYRALLREMTYEDKASCDSMHPIFGSFRDIQINHINHTTYATHTNAWHHVTHMNESCHTYEWVMSHI